MAAAAKPPAGGGKKLFGVPRTAAIIAIAAGLALVAYLYYRSRNSGTAQTQLPATTQAPADSSTAAPALGGTPAPDTSSTLSGADLVDAFNAQESLLAGGFQSQQQLIDNLAGGYEQLAGNAQNQLGGIAASLVGLIPKPGSTTATSTSTGGGSTVKTKAVAGAGSYDAGSGVYTTGEGVKQPPTTNYGGVSGPSIGAFK